MICWKQVTVAYNNDPSPVKINLGVGAYRTDVIFRFLLKLLSNFMVSIVSTSQFLKAQVLISLFLFFSKEGKPLVLDVVRKAEQQLVNDPWVEEHCH